MPEPTTTIEVSLSEIEILMRGFVVLYDALEHASPETWGAIAGAVGGSAEDVRAMTLQHHVELGEQLQDAAARLGEPNMEAKVRRG